MKIRLLRHPGLGRTWALLLGLLPAGCGLPPLPAEPIPVKFLPAPVTSTVPPLVIVLPGYADSLRALQAKGIAPAIQQAWPQADVMLTGATPGYYRGGKFAERLQADVIEPARQRGYRKIWLAGASLGGMGTLLYEQHYPGQLAGLVLFAPYMGETKLTNEIRAAGGLARWNPGPVPAAITRDNYQRELWRLVHDWGQHPENARRIWLAVGKSDRLRPAAELMAPVLPADHFLELPGGHAWRVWDRAAREIFRRIRTESEMSD